MQCPECDCKLEVNETRNVNEHTYRRRHCAPCDLTYITEERITELTCIPNAGRPRGRPRKDRPAVSANNPFGL